jgi:hypothetical protein
VQIGNKYSSVVHQFCMLVLEPLQRMGQLKSMLMVLYVGLMNDAR